jgi:Zn finger protein HypA/HybF involved in hydrogenase expression
MVGEVLAGLGAFKTMLDTAKALKNMNDAAIRNAAVIELQEQILAAQAAQSELVEHVHALETEVTGLKNWDADKQRYELKEVYRGAFAYVLKPAESSVEPTHWLCPTCYNRHQKTILQYKGNPARLRHYECPACHTTIKENF